MSEYGAALMIPENDLGRFSEIELLDELFRRGFRLEETARFTVYRPLPDSQRTRVVGIARADDPAIAYGLFGPATNEELQP